MTATTLYNPPLYSAPVPVLLDRAPPNKNAYAQDRVFLDGDSSRIVELSDFIFSASIMSGDDSICRCDVDCRLFVFVSAIPVALSLADGEIVFLEAINCAGAPVENSSA